MHYRCCKLCEVSIHFQYLEKEISEAGKAFLEIRHVNKQCIANLREMHACLIGWVCAASVPEFEMILVHIIWSAPYYFVKVILVGIFLEFPPAKNAVIQVFR